MTNRTRTRIRTIRGIKIETYRDKYDVERITSRAWYGGVQASLYISGRHGGLDRVDNMKLSTARKYIYNGWVYLSDTCIQINKKMEDI